MNGPIITCHGISKSYRLGTNRSTSQMGVAFTLRGAISDTVHSALRTITGKQRNGDQQNSLFWARAASPSKSSVARWSGSSATTGRVNQPCSKS